MEKPKTVRFDNKQALLTAIENIKKHLFSVNLNAPQSEFVKVIDALRLERAKHCLDPVCPHVSKDLIFEYNDRVSNLDTMIERIEKIIKNGPIR